MNFIKILALLEQCGEQVLHILWGAIPLLIGIKLDSWWGWALAAVVFALPREIIDQWPINHWGNTALDLLFFAIGGSLVGLWVNRNKLFGI